MVHSYCQDPFKKHAHRIRTPKCLRKVNETLSNLVNGKLEIGSWLCVNCIGRLYYKKA